MKKHKFLLAVCSLLILSLSACNQTNSNTTTPKNSDAKGTTGGNVAVAKNVGKTIAERAKAQGITKVVFDRGGYIYHGRVKAVADAAREAGLQF